MNSKKIRKDGAEPTCEIRVKEAWILEVSEFCETSILNKFRVFSKPSGFESHPLRQVSAGGFFF